jgi:hypothetical protein
MSWSLRYGIKSYFLFCDLNTGPVVAPTAPDVTFSVPVQLPGDSPQNLKPKAFDQP